MNNALTNLKILRWHRKFCPWFFFAVALLLSTKNGQAQLRLEENTEIGIWSIAIAPVKTTHIGSFERYAGPAIADYWRDLWRGGGHSDQSGNGGPIVPGRRPSIFRILLPSGRLPRDMSISYGGGIGWGAEISVEPNFVSFWHGRAPRFRISGFVDSNKVLANAPTGIGILTDPTRITARASMKAVGFDAQIPIFVQKIAVGEITIFIGHGWFWRRSETAGTANSAFLRLAVVERRTQFKPSASIAFEYRTTQTSEHMKTPFKFKGFAIEAFMHRDNFMWTGGATLSTIWAF